MTGLPKGGSTTIEPVGADEASSGSTISPTRSKTPPQAKPSKTPSIVKDAAKWVDIIGVVNDKGKYHSSNQEILDYFKQAAKAMEEEDQHG